MQTAIPQSWFGWDFEISQDENQPVRIEQAWFREAGAFDIRGERFEVRRDGLLGPFVLVGPAGQLAIARKQSLFKRSFSIDSQGEPFTLRASGVFSQSYDLYHRGALVGTVRRRGWFSRAADIDLPEDLPQAVRLFIFWLVLLQWRRAANSSNGAV